MASHQQVLVACGAAGPSDPYFSSVVALLHLNGTDGSTTFTDVIGNTWSGGGDAQIDTAQSQFGGASLLLDGTGDYIGGPSGSPFNFGTGDFTVECFVRMASLTGIQQVFAGSQNGDVSIYMDGGVPAIGRRSVAVDQTGSSGVSVDTWTHVAWSRAAGTLRIFVAGTSVASAANGNGYDAGGGNVIVGCSTTGGAFPFNGWMDEIRITKGVGRYTSNFTPPSAAFPDS
jgi:hypothetical protein